MNFNDISRYLMHGEKIYNLSLRVCFYARVSTDSDVQLNSLDNQLNYYKNYINSKPKWTFVGGYVDEGISGVRVEKRESFKKMIRDAKLNKFDLIITKDVSRFARDLEDSIHYIRELKDANVGIFFENQNLNTFDSNSELILNIMFNLAQDESRKLSSRVKFGHSQAMKRGHVLGSSNITGYKKDKCKLVIVEEEAEFIRKLFQLYATGKYGFYKLSKKLGELGFYNKNGNLYDKDTLKRMIDNPKYKGFYRAKTYEVLDYRTKKRKKVSELEQIIYKCEDGSVPAIVSEELWEKANQILKSRTKNYNNNNFFSGGLKYPFSSKIYCKEHNCNFQRSHGNRQRTRATWSCGMYLKYRLDSCVSPIIAEKDLYNIMSNIMNNIIPRDLDIVGDMLDLYKNIEKSDQYERKLNKIDEEIKFIEDKKTLALNLVFCGELKKEELKVQFEHYELELKKLNKKKNEIEQQIEIVKNCDNSIDNLSKAIQIELNSGSLEDFIRKFVDEIIVSKIDNDRYHIKLDIFLNLAGSEKSSIKGARHRTGIFENEILYMQNEEYDTIENLRVDRRKNKFNYNVYIESL